VNELKKIIGLGCLGAITLALLFTSIGNNNTAHENQTYNPGMVPPPVPILALASHPVPDVQSASKVVSIDVKSPSYLPQNYQTRVIHANQASDDVVILASKNPITSETSNIDFFWKEQGVLIYMWKTPVDFDKETQLKQWTLGNNAQQVSINGIPGAVHEIVIGEDFDGNPTHAPAELEFFKGQVLVEVRAMLPVDELIKIAETL